MTPANTAMAHFPLTVCLVSHLTSFRLAHVLQTASPIITKTPPYNNASNVTFPACLVQDQLPTNVYCVMHFLIFTKISVLDFALKASMEKIQLQLVSTTYVWIVTTRASFAVGLPTSTA